MLKFSIFNYISIWIQTNANKKSTLQFLASSLETFWKEGCTDPQLWHGNPHLALSPLLNRTTFWKKPQGKKKIWIMVEKSCM